MIFRVLIARTGDYYPVEVEFDDTIKDVADRVKELGIVGIRLVIDGEEFDADSPVQIAEAMITEESNIEVWESDKKKEFAITTASCTLYGASQYIEQHIDDKYLLDAMTIIFGENADLAHSDCEDFYDTRSSSPLGTAVRLGLHDLTSHLINKLHALPHFCDNNNTTTLRLAFENGDNKMIDILVDSGAALVKDKNGHCPVYYSTKKEVVEYYFENYDSASREEFFNPERVKKELNESNETANNEILNFLVQGGVNLNKRDSDGNYLLVIAARNRREDAFAILANAGANMNCATFDGHTPLIQAIVRGSYRMTEIALDHNANILAEPTLKFSRHATLLNLVLDGKFPKNKQIVSLLKSRGAAKYRYEERRETTSSTLNCCLACCFFLQTGRTFEDSKANRNKQSWHTLS